MDESGVFQNRKSRRSHVLMAATLEVDGASIAVKLRDLSSKGALIEGEALPPEGTAVRFRKGSLNQRGSVAWKLDSKAGIAFEGELPTEAALRRVGTPRPPATMPHRRPRLRGEQLSDAERRLAEEWIFGRPNPTVGD